MKFEKAIQIAAATISKCCMMNLPEWIYENHWRHTRVFRDRKGQRKRCLVLPNARTMREAILKDAKRKGAK